MPNLPSINKTEVQTGGTVWLGLLGIFVASRIIPWLTNTHVLLMADSRMYLNLAYVLKNHLDIATIAGKTGYLRTPLYPHLLQTFDAMQLSFRSVLAIQTAASFFTGAMLFYLSGRYFGKGISAALVFLYWLSPGILLYEQTVMPECFLTFFVTLSFFLMMKVSEPAAKGKTLKILALLFSLEGMMLTKPAGKIFTLIFVGALLIYYCPAIVSFLRNGWTNFYGKALAAILAVVIVGGLFVLKAKSSNADSLSKESYGLFGSMSVAMAPLLDFDDPLIKQVPGLETRLLNARSVVEQNTVVVKGYRLPDKNGGLSHFDALYWFKDGLPGAVFEPGALPENLPPQTFLRRWIVSSILHSPAHFCWFMARQLTSAVLMLSGSFMDEAPSLFMPSYATLVPSNLPILQADADALLEKLPPDAKKPDPAFARYYSRLFDVFRFKKIGVLLFRLFFVGACFWYFARAIFSIWTSGVFAFLRRDRFSFFTVFLFFAYSAIMVLIAPITPRYYVLIYGIVVIFMMVQVKSFVDAVRGRFARAG